MESKAIVLLMLLLFCLIFTLSLLGCAENVVVQKPVNVARAQNVVARKPVTVASAEITKQDNRKRSSRRKRIRGT